MIFIVGIYCSIFVFKSFYGWKQFQCKPGFYDIHNDIDILKCVGKSRYSMIGGLIKILSFLSANFAHFVSFKLK